MILEDKLGAIATSRSNKITPRTKHIDVQFHRVRPLLMVSGNVVDVMYIETGFH